MMSIALLFYGDNHLIKIAREFRKADIHWGIGDSKLLNFYEIAKIVNDLDLIVAMDDVNSALQILDKMGRRIEISNKAKYFTDSFTRFEIEGIELDVMANFKIEHEAGVYDFQFDRTTKIQIFQLEQELIPLTNLEEWYITYLLMKNQNSKVNMMEEYFITEKKVDLGLLMNRIHQGIPVEILLRMNKLVIEVRELMEGNNIEPHLFAEIYKN